MSYQTFSGIDIGKNEFVTATFGRQTVDTYENNSFGWSSFFKERFSELRNGNLPIFSGITPEPGFTFDMRGQTPTEEGNDRKEKWNGNKMDSMKSLVQKKLEK